MRENRTPGSVRGLSGNWQSYRDGGSTKNKDGSYEKEPIVPNSFVPGAVSSLCSIWNSFTDWYTYTHLNLNPHLDT